MRETSIKLTIIKIAYFFLVMIVSVLIIGNVVKDDNADMSAPMPDATLPVVTLLNGDNSVNPLHGYISDVDISYMRGNILPVGSSRQVSFDINTFERKVWDLRFEVRSIDGSSLVEDTDISDYREDENHITGSFQLKDLITAGREYMLVIIMETDSGTARFYSRVVWTEDDERYHVDEEIDFVKSFSEATFSKTAAKEYSKYLESNSEGDNTTFSRVNIHSSFSQVTWGDLNVTKHTDPDVYITDIHSQTGCYELQYRVTVRDGSISRIYNVVEDYRVRYTSDRMYLLNFERTMNYIFDASSYSVGSNSIYLGITDPDLQVLESSSGSAFAFVSENRLFMYNNTENKLAYLFGFYDTDHDDIRTRWNNHSVKILNVDEAGNVKFAVSGYMNRGIHEGCAGIAVYNYDASVNAVEEQIFVKSTQSAEIIDEYAGTLAYSSGDVFYVMIDQNIYAIDMISRQVNSVVDNIGSGEYKISKSESTIAWQGDDLSNLSLMSLNSKAMSEIEADSGDYIILLGFMGEDLVYGLVHEDDVIPDQMGNPIYAMYSLRIVDTNNNILENYHPDGVYVTGVSIGENQIKLTRVVKSEDGEGYVSTYDDQIMSTLKSEEGSNTASVVSVDVFEKIVQINTKSEIKAKQLRVLTPNQTLFEGERDATPDVQRDADEKPLYYVYGLGGIEGIYANPADAVKCANDAPGVVMDDHNEYVWIKGNLLKSNQIMSITRNAETYENMTETDSTVACLDLILQFEGINRNVEALMEENMTVSQILESSLTEAKILDLDGCPMSAMLYYVNQDIPVMAKLNNGQSMLIIGFNDLNTVLLNPVTGEIYKYGMNDSESLFADNGNHFITYIRTSPR